MLRSGDPVQNFVIVSLLGEGGMGQVYVARDTRLNRNVALKIMHPEADAPSPSGGNERRSEGAARLLREAQSAAALDHPNVVTIYEVGEVTEDGEKCPFIAMELVKGKTLRAYCGDPAIPVAQRLRWLADVARALGAAHKAGLVHRDIKPENVMIRDDGMVKVLDFGLAKRAARTGVSTTSSTEAQVLPSITAKGVAIGTPYYMAPEQMRNEALDGRADQFAWGVMAYELLSGAPTWGRDIDALELVSKVLSDQPTPLAAANIDVPMNVAAAVTRAMAKKRAERFDSMDDVLAVLDGTAKPAASPLAQTQPQDPAPPEASLASPNPNTVPLDADGEPSRLVTTAPTVPPSPSPSRLVLAAVAAGAIAAIGFGVRAWRIHADKATDAANAARADASTAECTASSQCVKKLGGKPAVCNPAGKCALLASEDCDVLADATALASDATVWFGTLLPRNDPDFKVELRAIDLARQDFAQMMSGFSQAGQHVRPFGLVACDDVADVMRAAHHLVDDVGVPAIIGFRSSAEVVDVGSQLLIPKGVVAIVPLSTSPLVTSLPQPPGQPRMIWRTTFSSAQAAKVIGHLLPEVLEPRFRQGPTALPKSAPLRVALVRDKGRGGATWDALLLDALRFNGRSVVENGDDFRRFVIDASTPESTTTDSKAAVGELGLFAPNVIVLSSDVAAVRQLVEPLEKAWSAARPRPVYVAVSQLPSLAVEWSGASAERRRRFFGVLPLAMTSVNARFVMHFNEGAPKRVTATDAPNTSYDSFYVLAYASYAVGTQRVTGTALASAIARLVPPGKPADVGPDGIFDAYSTLQRGEKIDLNGAFGSLDFDLTTGDEPFQFAVECIGTNEEGRANHGIESGLVYASGTDRLEGTMRCP